MHTIHTYNTYIQYIHTIHTYNTCIQIIHTYDTYAHTTYSLLHRSWRRVAAYVFHRYNPVLIPRDLSVSAYAPSQTVLLGGSLCGRRHRRRRTRSRFSRLMDFQFKTEPRPRSQSERPPTATPRPSTRRATERRRQPTAVDRGPSGPGDSPCKIAAHRKSLDEKRRIKFPSKRFRYYK